MLHTISICLRPHIIDGVGARLATDVKEQFGLKVDTIRAGSLYTIEGVEKAAVEKLVADAVLHDPVAYEASTQAHATQADWIVEVAFRPGVTDNAGRSAASTIRSVLGRDESVVAYSATQYFIWGDLSAEDIHKIAYELLGNDLIQRIRIKSKAEWLADKGFEALPAKVIAEHLESVEIIPVLEMDDAALMAFSSANTLALSLEEMQKIKAFYACPETQAKRKQAGMPQNPTDAEIEALAQTWSEHCKHKIFSAKITYTNTENGQTEIVNSLYKTCIQGATKKIRERLGKDDYCRSVFKDNAGVVAFNDTHDMCIKAETHNSPSALDPYGGAMTGILGVNRDAFGTGLSADLVCNTDVTCVASPFYDQELPPRLMHPRRILEGARKGAEDGSNKSGVPVVNGSLVFDERFLGKPLVYCGTVGLIPREINGRPGFVKEALVGDLAVMGGGRIGKDGIHGATFSSEELHEGSPATTVQIGDPILQRKLYDFTIEARNRGLFNSITDNGAGGISSSMGEMAEDTGGCLIDLAKAPVKYEGVQPWEILISEAQERMTYAVPPKHWEEFSALAKSMDVEVVALGEYTDSGYFHIMYGDKQVAYLPMDFLHHGVPQMKLNAVWQRPKEYPLGAKGVAIPQNDHKEVLLRMLGRLNICSKESLIRQFDHEVKAGTVVKPLTGPKGDGPTDAAVLRPLLDRKEGIVLSHGICPKFSDADTYWMMANAIDEAVRNAVAVGANPATMAGVDNFCWCDPVQSEKTPDGEYKLAQLVRANKALEHYCLGFGVPCVSGKDSMKNDYTGGGEKISIPPTVLFSVLGRIEDCALAVTSDFKAAGHAIYLLGRTASELAGSEFFDELGLSGGAVPQVDLLSAKERYAVLHEAMKQGLVSACHDLSDGGLAVALAEMALAGRLGATVDLDKVLADGALNPWEILYSESASRLLVTVAPDKVQAFERLFAHELGFTAAHVGAVEAGLEVVVQQGGKTLVTVDANSLAEAFKGTLQ